METTVTNGASVETGNHVIVDTDIVQMMSVKKAGSFLRVTVGVSKTKGRCHNKQMQFVDFSLVSVKF